jgi:hypothetical protein
VIARYGEAACRTFLQTLKDPTRAFTIQQVGPPETYDYASDGQSTTVPATRTIQALVTANGESAPQSVHVPLSGNHYTWFTDCTPT